MRGGGSRSLVAIAAVAVVLSERPGSSRGKVLQEPTWNGKVGIRTSSRPELLQSATSRNAGRRAARLSSLMTGVRAGPASATVPVSFTEEADDEASPEHVVGRKFEEETKKPTIIGKGDFAAVMDHHNAEAYRKYGSNLLAARSVEKLLEKRFGDEEEGPTDDLTPAMSDYALLKDKEEQLKTERPLLPVWVELLIWLVLSLAGGFVIYRQHVKLAEPQIGIGSMLCCLYCWSLGGFLVFIFPIDESPLGDSVEVVEMRAEENS